MSHRRSTKRVPKPACPGERIEPLPGQQPKSTRDDPQCPARLAAIFESSSYRPAIEDLDFLDGDDARGVRLQLDYLKPERLLQQHGVLNTIVVFGSTRLVEPDSAARDVEQLRAQLERKPGSRDVQRRLDIALRVQARSRYYEVAREFSGLVAEYGEGREGSNLTVLTGGGPGIMEAANRGAHDAGAKTVGLNITLPHEQYPNPYVSPELCFQFHYFALRKMHFLLRARALIAFPGGYGTLDELFETLTLIQTRKIDPLPVILVGEEFWRKAVDLDFLADEGLIDGEDRELFWYAETAAEIMDDLLHWYERAGRDLAGPDDR